MGSFSQDIGRFVDKTEQKMDLAFRKISLELFNRVILKTPVDTGRARGNWQVQIGNVPSGTLELNDASGSATISKASAAAANLRSGDVIYLVNNLPYIRRLEEGYSGQAPSGMVALTVQEFQAIADQVGAELILL